ncbi:hypothetical protein OX284_004960 [Flavobacterium sp. SUN046]|uniref:hypothetical protein n=1 Tax=Flavobacterium sp. SUN046 TaxID=3002440 RepID=UPI002DB90BC3|nr:hypothetical protein [Flavobacterium sp. SUN046]MEC4048771.1 hypothetical protein [Flavobacterium sp. SUN046]
MYDLLKNIADDNNWFFEYSRKDYQNLYDGMEIEKVHLFVDPITVDSKFSDSGHETFTYSGQLMLLVSSDVDQTYQDKYLTLIKPLIQTASQDLKNALICSDFELVKFTTLEAINIFDQNLDGVLITYSINQNY